MPVVLKTENRPRVVVVGGAHMEIVMHTAEPVPARGSITCERTVVRPGGRAACVAAALARLHTRVTFITCLGSDPFAGPILTCLSQRNINTSFIERSAPHATGLVHHVIEPHGAARRIFSPGASLHLSERAVLKASVQFSSADLVVVTPDIPHDAFVAALRLAHELRRPVVVDPAPADRLAPGDLAECDILCADTDAAAALCGWAIKSPGDAQRSAARILSQGAGAAVIDMGRDGVMTSSNEKQYTYTPAQSTSAFAHPDARAAFDAGLVWALTLGYSLSQAAWIAQSAAAAMPAADTRSDDFPAFPGFDELMAVQALHFR